MKDRANTFAAASNGGREPSATSPVSDEQDSMDLARLAGGHDPALNGLMERHAQKLFHYLVRALRDDNDAADVAQATFVRVYQNRKKFDPDKKFSNWLYAISSSLVRDRYRWRTCHQKISLDATDEATGNGFIESLPDENSSPRETGQVHERAAAVRGAVAALPKQLRVPLILAEYEEKSHAEIGEILRCSAKAVEVRISRSRQQLRVSLSEVLQTT